MGRLSKSPCPVVTIHDGATPPDADALTAEILARDYVLNIGNCLRRGWLLVKGDFWPIVGVTALVLALLWAAGSSEAIFSYHREGFHATTSLLGVLLSGPLMGGLYFFFLKKIRREPARVETAFGGFSTCFVQLFLANFVTDVLLTLGFICLVLPFIYLLVAWVFTLPLVIDKRLEFWPAMRLSRKTVAKHWWKFLGFGIVLVLFNLAGVLLLCVGVFLTFPISLAALMYAYQDIFATAPVGVEKPAEPALTGGAEAQLPAHAGRLKAILVVLLAAFLVVCASSALGTIASLRIFLVALAAALVLGIASVLLMRKLLPASRFVLPFLSVFLLVFGAGSLVISILHNSFASTARINLTAAAAESAGADGQQTAAAAHDPYRIQTELEVMRSEKVLVGVIRALNLKQGWGWKYAGGQALTQAETLELLRQRLDLHAVDDTSVIEIRVTDDRPEEAAKIANTIAEQIEQAYESRLTALDPATSTPGACRVEIIDRATPALRPFHPNRPLNLMLTAVLGIVLGVVAGACFASFVAYKKRG